MWEGSISFGLINIPIRLYTAARDRKLNFHFLHKDDFCPIKYLKVCKTTGKEIPYEEIVRGYEYEKGKFVVLQQDDFEKADVKKTHAIEIVQFVEDKEIDPLFFEKPYYLEPQKNSMKAYALLREALNKTKKVGIAKFVLRSREYLGMVKAKGDLLLLDQLRYADEVVDAKDLITPGGEMVQKKELDMAVKLIQQYSEPFKAEEFHDTYTQALEKIIKAKAKGKIIEPQGEIPIPTTEMEDILEKLKESLSHAKKTK